MRAGLGSSLVHLTAAAVNEKCFTIHELWGHICVSNNNLLLIRQSVTFGKHQHAGASSVYRTCIKERSRGGGLKDRVLATDSSCGGERSSKA